MPHKASARHRPQGKVRRFIVVSCATVAILTGPVAPATAAPKVPDRFTIQGSGYGHGVGMAQYGAYQMAREGFSANRILRHYYKKTQTGMTDTPRTIDVQVYGPDPYHFKGYGDSGPTQIDVDGGSWRLQAQGKTVASGNKPLKVSVKEGDVVVRSEGHTYRRKRMWLQWTGTHYYHPDGNSAVARIKGAHGAYRWGMLQLAAEAGVPNVINRLDLNSAYLDGIAEMPASWGAHGGAAALEAQAIVARSYALVQMHDWKPACRCHIVDDIRDQYFTGYDNEVSASARHWVDAVRATTATPTRAQVLTYSGKPVVAHYFSSSGGRTANSEDVWMSALSYERSVSDPYSLRAPGNSYVKWERKLTQKSAQKLFDLPRVASIKIAKRYRSGQAAVVVATAPSGKTSKIRGSADKIRFTVGSSTTHKNLPSSWIKRIRGA